MSEARPTDFHKSLPMRQSEVNYTTVSPQTGVNQCANCRFFLPSGTWLNGDQVSIPSCALVENYPLAILPTGYCDRHEPLPEDANDIPPMTVIVVNDDVERSFQAPVPVQPNMLKRWFGSKSPPATGVWRSASGLREGVIVTSNGFKDREKEHVATEALKEYARSCYDDDGTWKGDNRFLFYHGIDIGEVVAAGVVKGFLVEIVRERPGIVPETIWDFWQDTLKDGSVQWGASHGFLAKRKDDTFVRIEKKETSLLDVADAANLATYSRILPMSNEFKWLDAAFAKRGIQDFSKLIADKGLNAVVDELHKNGNFAKGTPTGTPPATPVGTVDYEPLLKLLMETIDEQAEQLDVQAAEIRGVKSQVEQRTKTAGEQTQQIDDQKKRLDDQVKLIEEQKKRLDTFMADKPRRASEDDATRLSSEDEATAKANIDARNVQFDPMFPGMNVPLKDGQ